MHAIIIMLAVNHHVKHFHWHWTKSEIIAIISFLAGGLVAILAHARITGS